MLAGLLRERPCLICLMSIAQTEILTDPSQRLASPDQAKTPQGSKVYVLGAAKLLFSLGLMYWILAGADFTEIMGALSPANVPLLCVAFMLNFVGYGLSVSRWQLLLKAQEIQASRFYLIQSYMVAFFFNNLLPSTFGGDAVRAYDSWRLGKNKAKAVVAVFTDRFLGLVALTILVWGGLTLSWELTTELPLFPLWIIGSSVGALGLCWLVFSPTSELVRACPVALPNIFKKVFGFLLKGMEAFRVFKDQKKTLLKALGLSLGLQVNVIVYYYLIAQSLHFEIPFHSFFFFIPLVLFMMMIPVTINGVGIRENAFAYFLGMFGVSTSEALAFAWLTYAFILIQGVLGGIVYMLRR